jgi:hypothetical protein
VVLGISASSASEDCSASFIGTESISKSTDGQDMHIEDPYVEIIGTVKDDLSVKALTSVNMGKDLSRWFSASLLPSATGVQLTGPSKRSVTLVGYIIADQLDMQAVNAVVDLFNTSKGAGVMHTN